MKATERRFELKKSLLVKRMEFHNRKRLGADNIAAYSIINWEKLCQELGKPKLEGCSLLKGYVGYMQPIFGITLVNVKYKDNNFLLPLYGGLACYFADIIITGKTAEEHLDDLEEVLLRLQNSGITTQFEKRQVYDEIRYFGHNINKNRIHPNTDKILPIMNFKTQINIQDFKVFLGEICFCSKFLEMLHSPIQIKAKIYDEPALRYYKPSPSIMLRTDASNVGSGPIHHHRTKNIIINTIMYAFTRKHLQNGQSKKFRSCIWEDHLRYLLDHRPLERIFRTNRKIPSTIYSRLVPMAIKLRMYSNETNNKSGMDAMKSLAKFYVWLPEISRDYDLHVLRCTHCQHLETERGNHRFILECDIISIDTNTYWHITSCRWDAEIYVLNNANSNYVIRQFGDSFNRFKVLRLFVTDIGTQFTSREFEEESLSKIGVKRIKISPIIKNEWSGSKNDPDSKKYKQLNTIADINKTLSMRLLMHRIPHPLPINHQAQSSVESTTEHDTLPKYREFACGDKKDRETYHINMKLMTQQREDIPIIYRNVLKHKGSNQISHGPCHGTIQLTCRFMRRYSWKIFTLGDSKRLEFEQRQTGNSLKQLKGVDPLKAARLFQP
ncbi:hypothetical protein RF11_12370 [Thelohanellus kitauei]|uniref:Integrase catalytic domain-containing protein n=1 Tax=Thelohanellus kitauei TaxID=669202 RepID=A0A0C2JU40_THEKT|nr:hypothetical protein RF11_12370 [Thelohanellus kitauei]